MRLRIYVESVEYANGFVDGATTASVVVCLFFAGVALIKPWKLNNK